MADSVATDTGHADRWHAVRAGLQAQRQAPPLARQDRSGPLPASFAQQRLWLLEQLSGPSAQHNLCVSLHLRGPLQPSALQSSLALLLDRHEALRTTLYLDNGVLLQRIHPATDLHLPLQQVTDAAALAELARTEAATPFDLSQPPLLRARLLQLDAQQHCLLLTHHHLAFDGWSFEVFMAELGQLYGALSQGQPVSLPPLQWQYADYAAWQRDWLRGEQLAQLRAYWLARMAGPPAVLQLPADKPACGVAQRRGACMRFDLPLALSLACKAMAAQEGVTLFVLLLAAYQTLLYRQGGQTDIVVGTPVANRNRRELQGLVGLLVNTLPLRSLMDGAASFRHLLGQLRQTVLEAYRHQDMPFELLVQALPLPRQPHVPPLVQTLFAYLNLPPSGWTLPGLVVAADNVANGTARVDLSLTLWERDGCLGGQLEYDCDRYTSVAASQLLAQWQTLLAAAVAAPGLSLDALPLLSPQARELAWRQGCGPRPDYPRDSSIPARFDTWAEAQPEAPALVCGGQRLSYGALARRANQLAHSLAGQLSPGALVGICLPAGVDYIVAMLAVLKCGAAFVPLLQDEPAGRVQDALGGQPLAMLLSHTGFAPQLAGLAPVLLLDDAALAGLPETPPGRTVAADDMAYVMFTSGSTGTPKGVCTPHRGVLRLVLGANYASLGPSHTLLQLAPLAFDAATFEVWGALLNGGRLVLPPMPRPSLSEIAGLIRQHSVTTLWLTTGLFEAMQDAEPAALALPEQLLVGGDVLSPGHARRYLQGKPAGRLINCYGPTENTTFSTFHAVTLADTEGAIPLGRPVSQTDVYILDSLGQPVPSGVVGEAWLGGDGLMRGYLGQPEATAAALHTLPLDQGQLLYRSGDRMRWREDGTLAFVGRADGQLKQRGYRVEPGEIEAVLASHPLVARALVCAAPSRQQLQAHVVAAPGSPDEACLRRLLLAYLRERLPAPLQPSELWLHASLPLTPTGKLDRAALQQLPRPVVAAAVAGPQTEAIAQLFADLLGLQQVGPDEDFFALGGHSLLALRLVAQLETLLGRRLPLAAVFEHATPAGLAGHIDRLAAEPVLRAAGLVEIRRGDAQQPLFMLPGGRGGMAEMTLYARLMQHLAGDRAVYGLLLADADPLPSSVSEAAARHIATLRRQQPQGPYALAGECVGGVLAYEMAGQLQAQGEAVSLLLLLDSWCPTPWRRWHWRCWQQPRLLWRLRLPLARLGWADFWAAWRGHVRQRPAFRPRRSLHYFYHVALTQGRIAAAWWRKLAQVGRAEAGQAASHALGANHIAQAMRYRPRPLDLPVQLLLSQANQQAGLARDWQALLGGRLRCWVAPGDHESYLRDTPQATAQVLSACLAATLASKEQDHG